MSLARIGGFSPLDSRIWRNLAHSRRDTHLPFVRPDKACDRVHAASLPQVICGAVYHFRTPSPGGQQVSQDIMLPTFFFVSFGLVLANIRRLAFGRQQLDACKHAFRRSDAYLRAVGLERLIDLGVCHTTNASNKGRSTCVSNSQFLPQRPRSVWPRVVTQWVSRLCSGALLAASEVPFLAATPSRVPLSVPERTCFIAKQTQANANILTRVARVFQSHAERRLAPGQGGVLRFKTQRSEALCSTRS